MQYTPEKSENKIVTKFIGLLIIMNRGLLCVRVRDFRGEKEENREEKRDCDCGMSARSCNVACGCDRCSCEEIIIILHDMITPTSMSLSLVFPFD